MILTYEEQEGAPLLVSSALSFHSMWTFSPADELLCKKGGSNVFSRERTGVPAKPPAIPKVVISHEQQKRLSRQQPTSTGNFVQPPKASSASKANASKPDESKPNAPKPTHSKTKPKLIWNSQTQSWVQQ